jgi:hypothetical protein
MARQGGDPLPFDIQQSGGSTLTKIRPFSPKVSYAPTTYV